jgi:glycosyltransferase involved in cell wall biosynthesis
MTEQKVGSLHINESADNTGGAETYLLSLRGELLGRGFPVKIVSGRPLSSLDIADSYYIPGIHKKHDDESNMAIAAQIKSIMEESGLDVINFHNFHNPSLYRQLSDKALIRTIHDSRTICPTEFRIQEDGDVCTSPLGDCVDKCHIAGSVVAEKLAEVEVLNSLDMLVVPSRYTGDQLEMNGVNSEKIEVIPLFLPKRIGEKGATDSGHTTDILFMGRVTRSKGLREAIAAFAKLGPNVRMTVCGDGPDLQASIELTRQLGVDDQIAFTGWVEPKERDSYLAGASLIAVPSMGPESFGLVGLEAMYYQKPVVGFNVGAIKEWLFNNVNGLLLPRGDIYSMAKAFEFLLANPLQAKTLGENGRNVLNERFSTQQHIDRITNLYGRLIK